MIRKNAICLFLTLSVILNSSALHAGTYYVCPKNGSDKKTGRLTAPFKTLDKAMTKLKPGDTCYLRAGVYRETLKPITSGKNGRPITIAAYRNDKVVISGADVLTGWKAEENGVYSSSMDWTLKDGDQVFINGEMICEARWPNSTTNFLFHPNRAIADEGDAGHLICRKIPSSNGSWKGAQVWCAGGQRWICWTVNVAGYDAGQHKLTFDQKKEGWFYRARNGSPFVLRGLRSCLDAPGEWFYSSDSKKMLLIPPEGVDPNKLMIEAKRRQEAIDLSGVSYIKLQGLEFRACGIKMNNKSSNNTLFKLKGRYVAHSYSRDVSNKHGVHINGSNNLVLNCDFGYSSASVLAVSGSGHRIINNYIHHGGYSGLWKGTVRLSGRRILFSHNTVKHAGRDLVNTHDLMESLVQYNDVSEAGWLTHDLGMFYGHNTDFANTVFRYNLVHDNNAGNSAMGIYFDHCSHNAIVHHNVVWNVGMDPLRINNPSYGNLVFNNSCWKSGHVGTFDHDGRNDLYECRYFKNILNKAPKLPKNALVENNMINAVPPYVNPASRDFRLKDAKEKIGAYSPGARPWKAGCDLEKVMKPLPEYKPPRIPWMNMVKNACFELKELESWEMTGAKKAQLTAGNSWGSKINSQNETTQNTGTSKRELRLGPGKDGVQQVITGLLPGREHKLTAWLRVSDPTESITLGVKGHGGRDVQVSTSSTEWKRCSVDFTTGGSSRQATIYITKTSTSSGNAWADNVTLPLTP